MAALFEHNHECDDDEDDDDGVFDVVRNSTNIGRDSFIFLRDEDDALNDRSLVALFSVTLCCRRIPIF